MDNLEKIVPLLIILVSFIAGIRKNIQNAKRQKQENQQRPPQQRPVILKQDTNEVLRRETKVEKVKASVGSSSDRFQQGYNPENVEPVSSVFTTTDHLTNRTDFFENHPFVEDMELSVSQNLNLRDSDEIKRAVIYAEILDRKYV